MNPVNYFEIPVTDLDRAVKFYSEVFKIELNLMEMPGMKMSMFPGAPDKPSATGSLAQGEGFVPSTEGTTVYFFCDDLSNELKRIEELGGKILNPKTSIGEMGFIAHFIDSEGNKVALHSIK
ncbi:MAG: VOC family protein [Bacteroidales bacterium]|jgi:predicted enzyme related to lactoylglutathione lyase|nr:VOC family protein [Bacteroidales bacterium]